MPYKDKEKEKQRGRVRFQKILADPEKKSEYLNRCRTYRKQYPNAVKNAGLKSRLGITLDYFEKLVKSQDNKCAVCECVFTETPHIDHDHFCCDSVKSCGKCIRGLLCRKCNAGLGQFNDNPEVLKKALNYLEFLEPELELI